MDLFDPVVLVKFVAFGCFLWLGIYIVSRAAVQTPLTIVSAIGTIAQAIYFFSSAIIANNNTGLGLERGIVISRAFWWSDVLPMAIWFHMSVLIARQGRSRRIFSWPVIIFYLTAFLISGVGTFSDFFLDYTHGLGFGDNRFYVGVGSAYRFFVLFLLLAGAGAFYNIWRALANTRRSNAANRVALLGQLRLLLVGALLFFVGALWLSGNFYFGLNLVEMIGITCLLLGLGFLGYGVAHYDLLVEGQAVQRDFIYSFTGQTLICIVYVFFLSFSGANSTLNILVVIGLAVITHSTLDFGRNLLDKFFFSVSERTARSEARAYATAIASQPSPALALEEAIATPPPVEETPPPATGEAEIAAPPAPAEIPVNEKSFNDMVRRAITGLKSPPQMIKSPLLSLRLVGRRLKEHGLEDNRLNRAAALRELLIERIERLRPSGPDTSGTGDAWRFYNVLYYPYVREISRKGGLSELRHLQEVRRRNGQREPGDLEQVLEWLVDVDEDTFYKWQRRASDTIAELLREEELKLAQGGVGGQGSAFGVETATRQ